MPDPVVAAVPDDVDQQTDDEPLELAGYDAPDMDFERVPGDEPGVAGTEAPLRSHGDDPVLVIDGRPRYHVATCGFIVGRQSEPIPLRQAVEDGFTPCGLCDPDTMIGGLPASPQG